MAEGPPNATDAMLLGPFDVEIDAATVHAFLSATRGEVTSGAPALFPAIFLGRRDIRAGIVAMLRPGELPVHEEQAVTIVRPLVAGESYRLDLRLTRRADPARLSILAMLTDAASEQAVRFETGLRLFDMGHRIAEGRAFEVAQQ